MAVKNNNLLLYTTLSYEANSHIKYKPWHHDVITVTAEWGYMDTFLHIIKDAEGKHTHIFIVYNFFRPLVHFD